MKKIIEAALDLAIEGIEKVKMSSTNDEYCKNCVNDYDDPQMCKFCKDGSHQTLGK
jgi:recombinational DNA repair protein RecR